MSGDDRVRRAVHLARDVAPDIDVILLTHYPDVETLDTLRPGETDLRTVQAVNRAVAEEMRDAGVEVFVQRADRAAFRRWIADRDNTPEQRRRWIDRTRLLKGDAAAAVLGLEGGLDESGAPAPDSFGKAAGPAADRLLDAYDDQDSGEFDSLVQELMRAGRTDVLDLAIGKCAERDGDEAGDDLNWVLLVAAEGATIGPSGWAELVALPVALPATDVPDGEDIIQGLIRSGALADTEEVRLLPGWRSPDALAALSFVAVRRLLLDLVDGKAPRDLPADDTGDLARQGFGVLIGLRIDWAIPVWEDIEAAGGLADMPEDHAAQDDARRDALFDRWRGRVFQQGPGCVPLDLVAFSQVANEIADFLAEAGAQTQGLDEIRAFVALCRDKAGNVDVVCHMDVAGEALTLSIYTDTGEPVDSLTVRADTLPVPAEEMPVLVGGFVRLVRDRPGP